MTAANDYMLALSPLVYGRHRLHYNGAYANWPIGLAPGMALMHFTYTVVGEMGYSWQVARCRLLPALFFFIVFVRRYILESIPMNLRIAMGAGVGLFIGFIG